MTSQAPPDYKTHPEKTEQSIPGQQPPMIVGGGCHHDFHVTGEWDILDVILCVFFCPCNFCCCPPGQRAQKCVKCGLKLADWH